MSSIYKALAGEGKSAAAKEEKTYKNRQRVLLISSRGVTFRHRHMINDLAMMMPHARKESKFDTKSQLGNLNEIAELYNCNNIFYFEARKHQDLYLWVSKAPNGPTAKFHIQNIHTMDELNFTGNCLKGSRPVLSFDSTFEESAHYKLIKEMLIHTMGVPPRARKSKPFVDHVVTLSIVDNKIWFRNYQISEEDAGKGDTEMSLVEIGPRFVMTLITILEGSFGGPVIYENKEFVSPNFVRAQLRQQKASQAQSRQDAAVQLRLKKRDNVLAKDPLANAELFKE
ncbi:ribosome biogenesis protein Brx1p [Trichomonascus vanleenenianus]|uniref:ribosome biogenesis protein BRX1 n=1 Tax=Trichomonascus vanleenenianus TaxID=2268995 RepID=UPI003EC989D9